MDRSDFKLSPETLSRLANLEIRARLVVEGFVTGLHKSPYHGFSVEFAEHRQYMPGDELKKYRLESACKNRPLLCKAI